jgi:hypothetical protein
MLRCAAAFRHCGVYKNTPHSEGFARLASGAFYEAVEVFQIFTNSLIVMKVNKP